MKLQAGKEYIARDGSKARVVVALNNPKYQWAGLLTDPPSGHEYWHSWQDDGRFVLDQAQHPWDLVAEAPSFYVADVFLQRDCHGNLYAALGFDRDQGATLLSMQSVRFELKPGVSICPLVPGPC